MFYNILFIIGLFYYFYFCLSQKKNNILLNFIYTTLHQNYLIKKYSFNIKVTYITQYYQIITKKKFPYKNNQLYINKNSLIIYQKLIEWGGGAWLD